MKSNKILKSIAISVFSMFLIFGTGCSKEDNNNNANEQVQNVLFAEFVKCVENSSKEDEWAIEYSSNKIETGKGQEEKILSQATKGNSGLYLIQYKGEDLDTLDYEFGYAKIGEKYAYYSKTDNSSYFGAYIEQSTYNQYIENMGTVVGFAGNYGLLEESETLVDLKENVKKELMLSTSMSATLPIEINVNLEKKYDETIKSNKLILTLVADFDSVSEEKVTVEIIVECYEGLIQKITINETASTYYLTSIKNYDYETNMEIVKTDFSDYPALSNN